MPEILPQAVVFADMSNAGSNNTTVKVIVEGWVVYFFLQHSVDGSK